MSEQPTEEPPSVTRLRELALPAMALEEIRNFEGQDADEVIAYIDRLTGRVATLERERDDNAQYVKNHYDLYLGACAERDAALERIESRDRADEDRALLRDWQ